MITQKDVLTTGQVAQICRVAPRTVTKWFDSGKLNGYRIPGSRDRRIPTSELISFMKTHNMPTEQLEKGKLRILLIDSQPETARQLASGLQDKGSFEIELAHNSFDAGLAAQKCCPNAILVDLMSPEINAHSLCSYVRDNKELNNCCVIALSGPLSPTETESLLKQGFDGVVTDSGDIHKILACIQEKYAILY